MTNQHVLIDFLANGSENRLECSCGIRIYPDCDISAASINESFEEHLNQVNTQGESAR